MATTTKHRSFLAWLVFFATSALYLGWFYQLQTASDSLQAASAARIQAATGSFTRSIHLSGVKLPVVIAREQPFRSSSVWAYVAPASPLPAAYKASHLKNFSTIAHAPEATVRLVPIAGRALEDLFNAARHSGHPLALSSAYRSIGDQSALYQSYEAQYGKRYADRYVALPRTSEHHTGLAIDISDYSAGCLSSAAACSLSSSTASWLAEHAPAYGFLLRYPEGKEAVTGVAYEPWHFRFIGKDAPLLTSSGLTLDEFVAKVNDAS